MSVFDKEVVDAEFEVLGVDGFYGETPCKLLFESDDDTGVDMLENSRPVGRMTVILVRDSEVTPAEGGSFTVGSETQCIVGKPTFKDTSRLVWRCRVVL